MPLIEIHVKGKIDLDLSEWFTGVSIRSISVNETCLYWAAADNSAIYGILSTLCSLDLSLISVTITDSDDIPY